MIEFTPDKRSAVPLTFCRRGQLAQVEPPAHKPTSALRQALRHLDKDIELYWHPVLERWILYRVVRRAGVSADDHLVKEFLIAGPEGEYREPGMWLVDYLRRADKTRNGSIDPHQANRAIDRAILEASREETPIEREKREISQDFTHELLKYGWGRTSLHVNRARHG